MGSRPAEEPAHRAVNEKALWLWNPKWRTVEERGFIEVPCQSWQMDRVLVASGIVDSRTNAQRLIKSNSISIRRDDWKSIKQENGEWKFEAFDWEKVRDFRQELEAGWPFVLRVGDGHWRTVMMEVEVEELPPMGSADRTPIKKKVTKPKGFSSLALVMRPMWVEGLEEDGVTPWRNFQDIKCWTDTWR